MSPVRVAVVGNLSLDLVDGGPPRPGGPPRYAARALAALGVPAVLRVKCAEADRSRLLAPLKALGLPVEWRPGATTATYAFSYDGDRRTMDVRTLGSPWSGEDVSGLHAEWVHVGALFRGEFPTESLAALTEAGARLSFDGQGLVRPARCGPLVLEPEPEPSYLRHISVLKLSEEEARALVGSLEERPLSELGVPEVVVTLGSRGCIVVARRRLVHVPADPIADCDPTGAGDAFAAGYVVERGRGLGPRQAAERATRLVHRLLASSR
ncbi:MAG: carbohydrate kinase family protein [Actinobacteria bacterium]|nr:MAG: carbohydrate kinase family protein [Actinomycetota bacterium]